MTSKHERILFVFAHQDDEFACAHHLLQETDGDAGRVFCLFTTDGGGHGKAASVRDAESREVLLSLGVRPENIFFAGSKHGVPDGSSVEHLVRLHGHCEAEFGNSAWRKIYCPAWEGGHPDHDAAHLLALALAVSSPNAEVWEFSIYQGSGTAWKFFRVLKPIRHRAESSVIYLSYRSIFRQLRLIFRYRSQRKTWLFLLPDTVWNLFSHRRELCVRVSPERISARPHEGALLYERIFAFPYSRFREAQRKFAAELLSSRG